MLTGATPFTGPTAQAIIGQTMAAAPRRGRSVEEVPPAVDTAVARALAKEPADRFATPRAFLEARDLAVKAERRIAGDATLDRLLATVSDLLTITTVPAGATVYLQRLLNEGGNEAKGGDSLLAGTTPIVDRRIARVDYRAIIRMPGHGTLERIAASGLARAERPGAKGRRIDLLLRLTPADSVPADMVAVAGGRYTIVSPDLPLGLATELQPFLLDRFEVTNAQYAEFMRNHGYAIDSLWRRATVDKAPLTRFVDRTGLPGPCDWVSQELPAGRERHPVTGVSWYEAEALCASSGKRLPTLYEWEKSARNGGSSHLGVIMPWGYMSAATSTERRANFAGAATVPVDALPFGISPWGAYAMAGNVKEWLANPVGDGFAVAGGSWQDPAYVFSELGSVPGAAANAATGFRCARNAGTDQGDQGDQGADRRRRSRRWSLWPVRAPFSSSRSGRPSSATSDLTARLAER